MVFQSMKTKKFEPTQALPKINAPLATASLHAMKVFMRNIPLKNFAILTALAIGVSVAGCAGGARVKRDTSYIARDVDTLRSEERRVGKECW